VKLNSKVAIPFALCVVLGQFFPARAAVSGAIFTTTADGSVVNANQYTSKCDVYLNGGPGRNAPAHAAALPAGDYFFQVTDPSGQTLLSTDVVNNRRFTVSADGVITAYTGVGGPVHPTGISQDHPELGAITIRLANTSCPSDYLDTTNNGGVYKAWATPVASFVGDPTRVDNPCGNGCFHGFMSSASKTDNFKVKPNTATFCLTVVKQLVDQFGGIYQGFNWPIALTEPSGVTNNFFTNNTDGSVSVCGLVAGLYTVTESLQGLQVVGLSFNGTPISPAQPVYSFSWASGMPNPVVVFQNFSPLPQ
jgi:hypothetical protein